MLVTYQSRSITFNHYLCIQYTYMKISFIIVFMKYLLEVVFNQHKHDYDLVHLHSIHCTWTILLRVHAVNAKSMVITCDGLVPISP